MTNEIEQLIASDGFDDCVSRQHQAAVREQMLAAFDERSTLRPTTKRLGSTAGNSNKSQWLALCYAAAACLIAMAAIAWQNRDMANNTAPPMILASADQQLQTLLQGVEQLQSEVPDQLLFEALDVCGHQYAAAIQSEQSANAVYFADSLHFPVN